MIKFLGIWLQQRFEHTMTAQLLCHLQNFVTIIALEFGWEQTEIPAKFEL